MIRNSFEVIKSQDKKDEAFLYIDGYSFIRINDNKGNILETNIKVKFNKDKDYVYGDFCGILKDIDQSPMYSVLANANNGLTEQKDIYLQWINKIPEEEIEYIRKYESEISEEDSVLFHDFRKKYIDICKLNDETLNCCIAFIGYTLTQECFEIKIKTFNYKAIKKITEKINKQFIKNKFQVQVKNLNWVRIKSFEIMENKRFTCNDSEKLLKYTTDRNCIDIFKYVFSSIDKYGFIEINETSKDGDEEREIKSKINGKKQIFSLFKPYSKLNINNRFMYIHEEQFLDLRDEKDNRVYSFSPRLMQYYEKQWFEDFIGEILESLNNENNGIKINDKKSGFIYNFYGDNNTSNNIEIDWLINVEKDGIHKTIGIECKKTLTKSYYSRTKNKVFDKIVKSGKDIIDGYIIVGFFKEDKYNNDLQIENSKDFKPENLFQEDVYREEDVFVEYISVCDTDIDLLINKLKMCIDIIFYDGNNN